MAKKEAKKECKNCIYFDIECNHPSNKGIKIKYRQEKEFYITEIAELNKDNDCKNYVQFSEK